MISAKNRRKPEIRKITCKTPSPRCRQSAQNAGKPVFLPGVKKIIYLPVTTSTQDIAKELAQTGQEEGTVVLAGEQTFGRGRMGRTWESCPGGIYLSIILNPQTASSLLGNLNLTAARAVMETLTGLYSIKCRIKPPNDVFALHPARRKYLKIAGILIESASAEAAVKPEWTVLGIGVNLKNAVSKDIEKTAVTASQTLKAQKHGADLMDDQYERKFLKYFFRIFWRRYSEWKAGALSRNS